MGLADNVSEQDGKLYLKDLSFFGFRLQRKEFAIEEISEVFKDYDGGSGIIELSGKRHNISGDLIHEYDEIHSMIKNNAPGIKVNRY